MTWFKKEKTPIIQLGDRTVRTEGLWIKCEQCKQIIWKKDLETNLNVCPTCSFHFKISAKERLEQLFDGGEFKEYDKELHSTDPLHFVDKKPYKGRLKEMHSATGLRDAIISAEGKISGKRACICAMEVAFISGSMGSVVGEKITRAIEHCLKNKFPLVIIACSGGARMQEGTLSLMQMAKITGALARLDEAKVPYISVMTDPTTGGVTASFAMLGDLNIAEPGALIGFAGPRVIEQTIRQKLPSGFQRSEFLLEHGMLDAIVHRREMRDYLTKALDFFGY
ncbi:MAG: acetyl-CoA carboxylase carboxyl transferase subunit beta [Acidobacteria bacterium]|nr:MAG: acetyl-CoA carboxylase carboxyl transferase subunit beta [Acidobacteriota bacterium]